MATQIPEAPTVPQLGSSTFENDMKAFHEWEKTQLQPNANQLAQEVEDNKNTTEQFKNEAETYKDAAEAAKTDAETAKSNCEAIKSDIQTIVAADNYQGDYSSSTTYSMGETVKYDSKLWVSTQSSNLNHTPTSGITTWWMAINDLDTYILDTPTVTTSNINENSSGTHAISNYDSDATYVVSESDSLISSISVSGNTISITTGDITDGVNHTGTYTIEVRKAGYLYSTATITFTIVYISIVSDDALLWEGTTYEDSYFDEISGGSIT